MHIISSNSPNGVETRTQLVDARHETTSCVPVSVLLLSGTRLYGTTSFGGANFAGNILSVGIDGSDYEDLYNFKHSPDGYFPEGDLLLSGGTLFGATKYGGANGDGTVFALTLPTPTPEPSTLALVGGTAAALLSYRWRKMRGRVTHNRPRVKAPGWGFLACRSAPCV